MSVPVTLEMTDDTLLQVLGKTVAAMNSDPADGPNSLARQTLAYQWALARGNCLLFGVEIPADLNAMLSAEQAASATRELNGRLEQWIADAATLRERWEQADDESVAEAICLEALTRLMESWACPLAIDESQLISDELDPEFATLLETLHSRLKSFGESLLAQTDVLSFVADAPLLKELRQRLAEEFHELLPWWLDGTLEQAAQADERELAALAGRFWSKSKPTIAVSAREALSGGELSHTVLRFTSVRLPPPYVPAIAAGDAPHVPDFATVTWFSP
ncbi:MAG: hypothetical protein IAG10_24480, partial [Planctomycetaceae bacterium]|nr:hypothetical protein [Planctomycetaceae bacterium]